MKNPDVFMITAQPDEVPLKKSELAYRLGVARGYSSESIERCTESIMKKISYKCSYVRVPVDMSVEGVVDLGFMRAESRNLYKNLTGCSEAFVLAVTCGIAVDRELARLSIVSQADHFVSDAVASAAADSFCSYACGIMKKGLECAPRYSPGYGDLSISFQPLILERLNARELLGITLNSSYLMTPMKSITAIMGIRK